MVCPNGHTNDPAAHFCSTCGVAVDPAQASEEESRPQGSRQSGSKPKYRVIVGGVAVLALVLAGFVIWRTSANNSESEVNNSEAEVNGQTRKEWIAQLKGANPPLRNLSDAGIEENAETDCRIIDEAGGLKNALRAIILRATETEAVQQDVEAMVGGLIVSIQWKCPEYYDDVSDIVKDDSIIN